MDKRANATSDGTQNRGPNWQRGGNSMSEVNNHLFDTIDRQQSHESAHTRRTLVKSTAAALGSMGLLGYAAESASGQIRTNPANSVANITTVAATAEVLATIVNTV
ncbi:MAG: hypothetical protein H0V26_05075, partial [Solirubrobacterales bacterium]|nr:hypothetical protein [Solirubrobacterales bacterium]